MKLRVLRDVTWTECPWIPKEGIKAGAEVWSYHGHTYGVIGPNGTACTFEENVLPFFELPSHVLVEVGEVSIT